MIEVSEQTIDRMHVLLAGIEDADKKVLKPALTRGLMAGKTAAKKAVRQTYHISASDFDNRGRLQYNAVSEEGDGVIGSLQFSGGVIPLMKFKVSPAQKPRQGVLFKAGHRAAVKAQLLPEIRHEILGQHHIADTDGRR